jgi:acetamidase/formamidase
MVNAYLDGHRRENLILSWSSQNTPVLEISSGDTVTFDIPDSSTDQVKLGSSSSDVSTKDGSLTDAAVGPVYVRGAKKGDILRVDVLDIKCGNWGWSMHSPDFGLLSELFPERKVYYWSIADGYARPYRNGFLKGLVLRTRPFMGVMGVAPSGNSDYPLIPPQYFGGNMDNRRVRRGSTVLFPVNVEGALFATADTHALQGDGEVCGTAIETESRIRLKLSVISGKNATGALKAPLVISKEYREESTFISTSGISDDPYKAAKSAVSQMIELLNEAGLDRSEAYILCSLAGNLSISEVVDMPNWNVTFSIDVKTLDKLGLEI